MQNDLYLAQLKKLLHQYHPDHCRDPALLSYCNEITKRLVEKLKQAKISLNSGDSEKDHANNDYNFYKKGIDYYKKIHTDQFYTRAKNTNYESKPFAEQIAALNNIFTAFELARFFFKKVIDEFPKSVWVDDSKEKLALLDTLSKIYENFSIDETIEWNNDSFMQTMGLKILP